jgi:hypothetical protein
MALSAGYIRFYSLKISMASVFDGYVVNCHIVAVKPIFILIAVEYSDQLQSFLLGGVIIRINMLALPDKFHSLLAAGGRILYEQIVAVSIG